MRGIGRGNWPRVNRRQTVQESLILALATLERQIFQNGVGTITWSRGGQIVGSIGYVATWHPNAPTITIHYRWGEETDIQTVIRLEGTRTNFGGRRWWFTCPASADGMSCNRRAGKLYLPPGGKRFACRQCHNLTYQSCQEAHQAERLFTRMGLEFGVDRKLAKLLKSRRIGSG